MTRLAAWLVAAVLGACSSPAPTEAPATEPLFYPRHEAPYGTGEMAGLDGTLVFRDGCLWIDADDGSRFLAIWPADTKPGVINSLPVVLMADDVLVLETGDPTLFGGSEAGPDRVAAYLRGIPETCRPERFWMITLVDRETE